MVQISVEKALKGCEIQISADEYDTARRVYRSFLRASLKADKCTKTTWQGQTSNGNYSYRIAVPGLPYVVACERVAQLFPSGERTSYPHPLIGG